MSKYYSPKRTKNLFDPSSSTPFVLSRSKIDLFLNCERCFYLDRRLGVGTPPGYPFTLNSAVDTLLKKEFDRHRHEKTKHPIVEKHGVDAIPFYHPNLDEWRENFKGVRVHHKPTNFIITGAIDDLWINPNGELIIVDYKSTSKDGEVSLDADWQDGYKRQMEVYQWLFKQSGFGVNPTGYFVYCNGDTSKDGFYNKLEFDIKLIPYTGDDSWVEPTLQKIYETLSQNEIPNPSTDCDFCAYHQALKDVEPNNQPEKIIEKVVEKIIIQSPVVKKKSKLSKILLMESQPSLFSEELTN